MGDVVTDGKPPEETARKVIIDPSHPHAGHGGVVPPEHSRIKPGQVLNPGGRPKGYSPRAALRRLLAEKTNAHGEGEQAAAIAQRIVDIAEALAAGGMEPEKALKVLEAQMRVLEQVDGKPKETVEYQGELSVRRVILEGIDPLPIVDAPSAPAIARDATAREGPQ